MRPPGPASAVKASCDLHARQPMSVGLRGPPGATRPVGSCVQDRAGGGPRGGRVRMPVRRKHPGVLLAPRVQRTGAPRPSSCHPTSLLTPYGPLPTHLRAFPSSLYGSKSPPRVCVWRAASPTRPPRQIPDPPGASGEPGAGALPAAARPVSFPAGVTSPSPGLCTCPGDSPSVPGRERR